MTVNLTGQAKVAFRPALTVGCPVKTDNYCCLSSPVPVDSPTLLPEKPIRSDLIQIHGRRRYYAAVTDLGLEGLEGGRFAQRIAAVFGLNRGQMNETDAIIELE